MKKFILIALLLLAGCNFTPVKEVIWTTPQFEIPKRPLLTSDGKGTAGEIARKNSNDLILMRGYAFDCENLLYSIKAQSGVKPTPLKKTEINK